MKQNQKRIELDWSKLYGFKLIQSENPRKSLQTGPGAKVGVKLGVKIGVKLGAKPGLRRARMA